MGTILSSKMKDDGKIIFEICVDYDEATQLKGHMENIHLFSENVEQVETHVSTRGKNDSTKYFLLPREFRSGLQLDKPIACQKIETKTKNILVYVIDKF
jgi:hypothetical protein